MQKQKPLSPLIDMKGAPSHSSSCDRGAHFAPPTDVISLEFDVMQGLELVNSGLKVDES
jgi:hypothetical protein